MKKGPRKILITVLVSAAVFLLCIAAGSVRISFSDLFAVLRHHIGGVPLPAGVAPMTDSILWKIRLPRVCTAFLVGGALSVSGAVMQAVLENPLASSYTLGVSSGASLGAAVVIISGVTSPVLAGLLLPVTGFAFGLATVLLAIAAASRLDRNVHNQTIILVGMVLSLFVSAVLSLGMSLFPDHAQQLYLWMTGSFSAKTWGAVRVLLPVSVISTVLLTLHARELDILTFGDEQSMAIGVDTKRVKTRVIVLSSILTGAAVSFSGVIGFIDLVAPHVVRRVFGPRHRVVLPMSFFAGGAFMALCDLVSRTVLAPREIPVGAVTALIGAPFFAVIYFGKHGKGGNADG